MSECKYCKKESYGRPFCVDCGKKYFGFEAPLTIGPQNQNIETTSRKKIKSTKTNNEHKKTNNNATPKNISKEIEENKEYLSKIIEQNEKYLLEEIKENEKYLKSFTNNIDCTDLFSQNYVNKENITLCKICNLNSHGKTYCNKCYKKLQKGKINIDKNNNSNDSFFDSKELKKYNLPTKNPAYALAPFQEYRIYKCKNGNMVRSKSEREISDFLTEHQIEHAYEKALRTNNKECPYLHPDFYIPGIITHTGRKIFNIYIEHLGGPMSDDPDKVKKYWDNNSKKFHLYEQMNLTVLCTYEKDMINPNASLKNKILSIEEGKINY